MFESDQTASGSGGTTAVTKGDLDKIYGELFNGIQTWKPFWKQLKQYINPHLGFFEEDTANWAKRDDEAILNSTPIEACEVLAAGMQNGVTSPSRPWFKWEAAMEQLRDDDDAREWTRIAEKMAYDILERAAFYEHTHPYYEQLGCFCSAAMVMADDPETLVRFRTLDTGEYAVGLGPTQEVERFARFLRLTVSQVVEMFGKTNCPPGVVSQYDRRQFNEYVKVKHVIFPNPDYDPKMMDYTKMKYRSYYWMDNSLPGKFLSEGGHQSMPVFFCVWKRTGFDTYGKGPGWRALPDSKMLQEMEDDILTAHELSIKPSLNVPDTLLSGSGVSIVPGGINPYAPTQGQDNRVTPTFQVNFDFNAAELKVQAVEQRIKNSFFANVFLMLENIDHAGMTAREILERSNEKMSMIGPVLDSIQNKFLRPLMMALFEKMIAVKGLLPPPPPSLQGQQLQIRYVSILAQAQQMTGITAIEQTCQFVLGLAQADPNAKDKLDIDAAIDEYSDALGIPPKIIVPEAKVAIIRQQRAQMQQQAEKMQQAQQMAAIAQQGSQAVKNLQPVDTGSNNALSALMGTPSGAEGAYQG